MCRTLEGTKPACRQDWRAAKSREMKFRLGICVTPAPSCLTQNGSRFCKDSVFALKKGSLYKITGYVIRFHFYVCVTKLLSVYASIKFMCEKFRIVVMYSAFRIVCNNNVGYISKINIYLCVTIDLKRIEGLKFVKSRDLFCLCWISQIGCVYLHP